jgi:hypothetical protein
MPTADLKKELRTVEHLISTLKPNEYFVEDLVCLEMNRKALRAALSIQNPVCSKRDDRRFAHRLREEQRTQELVASYHTAE